jgi:hypothetical protein
MRLVRSSRSSESLEEHLLAVDRERSRSSHPDAYLIAAYLKDSHADILPDH